VTGQPLGPARLEGGGWEEIEGEVRRADGKEGVGQCDGYAIGKTQKLKVL
jgi:hypothetical protein